MGYRYFYIFMAFNWVAAVMVYFFYPETQGHTLETVNELFDDLKTRTSIQSPENVEVGTVYPEKETMKVPPSPELRKVDPASSSISTQA